MPNKTINDFDFISSLSSNDELVIFDVANNTTNKVTVSAIAALVSSGVVPVNASNVAAAGAVMDSYFNSNVGYAKRTGSDTYTAVTAIPSFDIAGLGTLATVSTAGSAISFMGLGTLATQNNVNTAQVSGLSTFTISAGQTTGFASVATVGTLNALDDVNTAGAAGGNVLGYNGASWIPVSVTGGGGGSSTLAGLSDVSLAALTNGKVLTYQTSDSKWVATSVTGGGGTVDASAISAAGGILETQFTGGLGYVKKTGTQAFAEVCTIPSTDITGLGTLATTSTVVSAQSYLNLGTLATVSTAASGISFLGLGVLATTSTQASAATFLNLGTLATVSTAASGQSFLDLGTLATTSTAASGRSFLGLGGLAVAPASVGSAATSTYMMYNGSQWVPTSITGGGSSTLASLTDVSLGTLSNGQVLTYDSSSSLWVATSTNNASTSVGYTGMRAASSNFVFNSTTPVTVVGGWLVLTDTMSAFSSTTGRFIPKVAGVYQFSVVGRFASIANNDNMYVAVAKNGSFPTGRIASTNAPLSNTEYGIVYNDVVSVNGTTDSLVLMVYGDSTNTKGFNVDIFNSYLITSGIVQASGTIVDASSVQAAGAVMTSFFSGTSGYMRKTASSAYDVTTAIPVASITGLSTFGVTAGQTSGFSPIAYTSTVASAQSYLNLGTLATTSTAASAKTFLGITSFGSQMTSVADASGAKALLGLAITATTDNIVVFSNVSGSTKNSVVTLESAGSIYGYQGKLNTIAGSSYTVVSADTGKILMTTAAVTCSITLPNSMQPGFNATLIQHGAGVIQFIAGTSSTLEQRQSFTKTAGQHAIVGLIVSENSNGTAAHYTLSGDMA